MRENLKPGIDLDQSASDAIPRRIYVTRMQRGSIKVRLQFGEESTAGSTRPWLNPGHYEQSSNQEQAPVDEAWSEGALRRGFIRQHQYSRLSWINDEGEHPG